ncbi:MAG: hypothetical protein A3F84_29560 [Candidatus Handelsmanbacteria bacterium RIFCSPLOWO2_12_FULL_64_10]|uniref:Uncharacterized protein n=1 Tax=Handelsmanbacteria sp. (strain RIFCSPLOWO2_12_FULL_64_10) TaxID=1817868 RepID=A0A1F6C2U6_HANXR|nr:MAG: hypothetical protein A3F84_29560 [Candidatus Handelsmanbacteria bacterium RIFCSPLOWO2_12_FULL_64_10]
MRCEAWGFGLRLILAFIVWSLIAGPLLPFYARAVTPVAQGIVRWLRPHDASIVFTDAYPEVIWQTLLPSQEGVTERISFRFLSYNLILYLALLSAIPRLLLKHRVVLLLTGLPLFLTFHVVDLLLTVESRLLTHLQPQSYTFWRHFNPWFLAVKFYASFSVMALKQVFPVFVLFVQWLGMKKLAERTSRPPLLVS